MRRFGNYFRRNDEHLADLNRQRREFIINNCVQVVTRNNGTAQLQDSCDLTNLILDNYTFQPNPFSKEEIQEFLNDPVNSKTIIEKANE